MTIIPTKPFLRQFSDLVRGNNKYRSKVLRILKLMEFNLKHPSLRSHKLRNRGIYSISVDMKIRLLFVTEGDTVRLLEIGNHDEVY